MTAKSELYAVIWSDFGVPLNLLFETAEQAINKARDMHAKAFGAHIRLGHLRAVHLTGDDKLITLWDAPAAI